MIVIPAQAGIRVFTGWHNGQTWTPAFAGVTS
jgi:hypothetical protein